MLRRVHLELSRVYEMQWLILDSIVHHPLQRFFDRTAAHSARNHPLVSTTTPRRVPVLRVVPLVRRPRHQSLGLWSVGCIFYSEWPGDHARGRCAGFCAESNGAQQE